MSFSVRVTFKQSIIKMVGFKIWQNNTSKQSFWFYNLSTLSLCWLCNFEFNMNKQHKQTRTLFRTQILENHAHFMISVIATCDFEFHMLKAFVNMVPPLLELLYFQLWDQQFSTTLMALSLALNKNSCFSPRTIHICSLL